MKKKEKPSKQVSYEQLGRMLDNIYQTGYIDRNQFYKMSFLKGVVAGFGGVIGATLVVALMLWLLTILNYTPLRPVTERLQETVKSAD